MFLISLDVLETGFSDALTVVFSSCPEEEGGRTSESDEERRKAEARVAKIQQCQGVCVCSSGCGLECQDNHDAISEGDDTV